MPEIFLKLQARAISALPNCECSIPLWREHCFFSEEDIMSLCYTKSSASYCESNTAMDAFNSSAFVLQNHVFPTFVDFDISRETQQTVLISMIIDQTRCLESKPNLLFRMFRFVVLLASLCLVIIFTPPADGEKHDGISTKPKVKHPLFEDISYLETPYSLEQRK